MDFSLTDNQQMVRETLRRYLAQEGADRWSGLAELGVCGIVIPASYGGIDGNSIDAMVVAEELGRAVVALPFIESGVIAAALISRLGSDVQKQQWLPAIAKGRLTVALALASAGSVEVDANQCLWGSAPIVSWAPGANVILLAAGEAGGVSLFSLEAGRVGVELKPFQTIDGLEAASVSLLGVEVQAARLGGPANASAAIEEAIELGVSAQCGEIVGLMATLLSATIEHLKTRRQFGRPLSEFQALQHRLADMYMVYEQARSIMIKASICCAGPRSAERTLAVAAAKVEAVRAAKVVGHESIQMHGAMGMTEELVVGRAVKRLRALDTRLRSSADAFRLYQASRDGAAPQ